MQENNKNHKKINMAKLYSLHFFHPPVGLQWESKLRKRIIKAYFKKKKVFTFRAFMWGIGNEDELKCKLKFNETLYLLYNFTRCRLWNIWWEYIITIANIMQSIGCDDKFGRIQKKLLRNSLESPACIIIIQFFLFVPGAVYNIRRSIFRGDI